MQRRKTDVSVYRSAKSKGTSKQLLPFGFARQYTRPESHLGRLANHRAIINDPDSVALSAHLHNHLFGGHSKTLFCATLTTPLCHNKPTSQHPLLKRVHGQIGVHVWRRLCAPACLMYVSQSESRVYFFGGATRRIICVIDANYPSCSSTEKNARRAYIRHLRAQYFCHVNNLFKNYYYAL